jgi:hypothetical protein
VGQLTDMPVCAVHSSPLLINLVCAEPRLVITVVKKSLRLLGDCPLGRFRSLRELMVIPCDAIG